MGKTLRRNNDKCVVKQNWLNYGGFCGLSPQPSYKQVVIAINKNRSYPLQPMSNRWKNNKVFNKNISHRFFSYLFSRVENLWYFFLLPSARNDWKLEQHLMLENIPSKICSMKREFPPSDSFIPAKLPADTPPFTASFNFFCCVSIHHFSAFYGHSITHKIWE